MTCLKLAGDMLHYKLIVFSLKNKNNFDKNGNNSSIVQGVMVIVVVVVVVIERSFMDHRIEQELFSRNGLAFGEWNPTRRQSSFSWSPINF